jgi:hypothetical protein
MRNAVRLCHRLVPWLIIAAVLAAMPFAAAGCGSGGDGNAVQTTLSGADIAYSYPKGYEMPPGGPGDSAITYLRYIGDIEDYEADRMLFIETEPLPEDTSAADMLQQSISAILSISMNFQLIKRTTTKVAGYHAELLAFTSTFGNTPLTSTTTTTWVAYLEREGLVWEMGAMTNADLEGAAEADFKHLTDSFSFE